MAISCNISVLESLGRVGAFRSAAEPRVKSNGINASGNTRAQSSLICSKSRSLGAAVLNHRRQNVHHSLQNFKCAGPASQKKRGRELPVRATLDADLSEQISGRGKELKPLEIAIAGASLVALDKGTALALNRWQALPAVIRRLPSSTVCLLLVVAGLLAVDRADPTLAKKVTSIFEPAVEILQRWMPLFYTPAVVMMSLFAQTMSVEEGVRLTTLLTGGWVVTLVGIALLASAVRRGVSTQLGSAPNMSSTSAYSLWEIITWAGVGAASGLVAYLAPNAFGLHQATVAAPFFVCATVTGFLLGSQVPTPFKRILHPVITAAAFVNVIAYLAGIFTNRSFETMLGMYLTKNLQTPGGGDILMALLGPLTISYAFTLFRQRSMLRHHATELATVVPIAAIFSLLVTIIGGRQLGLHDFLTRSVASRSTTLAFAIPISTTIGGDEALAATAAVVTGILGANLSLWVLSALKVQDGVARALATACSSHGFGSAAVAAGDVDLLPFCLVTYILMGAVCSVAVNVPLIHTSVLQL